MPLAILTIANSIADLEVAGVRIRDLDQIPDAVQERDCPILIPEVINFVTDLVITRDSTGADYLVALKTATYTLNYTFLYAPAGSDRAGLSRFDDFVRKAFAIIDEVILNSTVEGLIDITPQATLQWSVVLDPAGNAFMGCMMAFAITELIN
jgi:hypothetical protein